MSLRRKTPELGGAAQGLTCLLPVVAGDRRHKLDTSNKTAPSFVSNVSYQKGKPRVSLISISIYYYIYTDYDLKWEER